MHVNGLHLSIGPQPKCDTYACRNQEAATGFHPSNELVRVTRLGRLSPFLPLNSVASEKCFSFLLGRTD